MIDEQYIETIRKKMEKFRDPIKRRKELYRERMRQADEEKARRLAAFEAFATFFGSGPTPAGEEEGGRSPPILGRSGIPGSNPVHERTGGPRPRKQ